MNPIILGVSGASGIPLAIKALHALTAHGEQVELIFTKDAQVTAVQELGPAFSTPEKIILQLPEQQQPLVRIAKIYDFYSPIASGSFQTKGMIIVPCSMATLAAISMGLSDNVLRRAADVTLKENRKLLISPREAPFSQIHLENMLKLSRAGAIIFPAIPAWYAHPKSLEEAEWYMVHRMLDHFIPEKLKYDRWGSRREEVSEVFA
jgi:4-hydroxy-3-polyprenylbenzoate decarboxylase